MRAQRTFRSDRCYHSQNHVSPRCSSLWRRALWCRSDNLGKIISLDPVTKLPPVAGLMHLAFHPISLFKSVNEEKPGKGPPEIRVWSNFALRRYKPVADQANSDEQVREETGTWRRPKNQSYRKNYIESLPSLSYSMVNCPLSQVTALFPSDFLMILEIIF